jgi:hypothetical protein
LLTIAQKSLRELKGKISAQSKKNFVLERDVRYLDSRIALLIQNRMALDEQNEFAARIEEAMDTKVGQFPDDRKVQVFNICDGLTVAIRKFVSFTAGRASSYRDVVSSGDDAGN